MGRVWGLHPGPSTSWVNPRAESQPLFPVDCGSASSPVPGAHWGSAPGPCRHFAVPTRPVRRGRRAAPSPPLSPACGTSQPGAGCAGPGVGGHQEGAGGKGQQDTGTIPTQHCPTHLLHQLLQHLEGGTALAGESDQVGVSCGPGLAALSPELVELLEGVFLILPDALALLLALLQVSRDLTPGGCNHLLVKTTDWGLGGKFLLGKGGPAVEWGVQGSGCPWKCSKTTWMWPPGDMV